MRRITELSTGTPAVGQTIMAAAVAVCALAAACSQPTTSPAAPTATPASTAAAAPDVPRAQGTSQSWEDFKAHGWNCRTPAPGVVVCSPPGQPLPVVAIPPAQPPDDRPETVILKRWRDGVFDANVLLIRPEIYNGQLCEPTGQPYSYITVLGYYECAHPAD
jgi:hypothetical protein